VPADTDASLLICGAVVHPLEMVQRSGPMAPLLSLVQPLAGADHATVSSRDGQYRASVPVEWLVQGRLDHGRLRIPAAPTRCWSVKDVVSIELTVGSRPDSVRADSFTATGAGDTATGAGNTATGAGN
jgi:hypothetical protein